MKRERSHSLYVCLLASAMLLGASAAQANIVFNGATGDTVYGVTNYAGGAQGVPKYMGNNVTGLNDILASPGGTYQLANPVIANNVAQSGFPVAAPYFFNWTGGGNANGQFGTGLTTNYGPSVAFALSDTTIGCCAASYSITSWFSDFKVNAAGFAGNLGAYLAIAGNNLTAADSGVAALQTEWSINGGAFVALPQLVLAAGGNCSDVAIGGSGAAILNNGCNGGTYRGLAIDNLGFFRLAPGTDIRTIATLTAYADPSSIDTIIPDDALIAATGASLPDFALADAAAAPEPGLFGVLAAGLASMGLLLRRRRI